MTHGLLYSLPSKSTDTVCETASILNNTTSGFVWSKLPYHESQHILWSVPAISTFEESFVVCTELQNAQQTYNQQQRSIFLTLVECIPTVTGVQHIPLHG